jgi:hypothetical protein
MRANTLLLFPALVWFTACSSINEDPGAQSPSSGKAARQSTPATPAVEGRDYMVFERVRFSDDKGYIQPLEAFSVLIPRGWKSEGGVRWKNPFNCQAETVGRYLNITSADGGIQYRSLPLHGWGTTTDPDMRQQMQMLTRHGGCEVGPPMSAEQYLREFLGPREFGNPGVVSVQSNQEVIQNMLAEAEQYRASAASLGVQMTFRADAVIARLQWGDGLEGIAMVTVLNGLSSQQNQFTGAVFQKSHTIAAERTVVRFPASRRAEAEKFLATLRRSYRANPEWRQALDNFSNYIRSANSQNHNQVMGQLESFRQQMMAQHQQRMEAIRQQAAANNSRYQDRMYAMDQNMRSWEAQQASGDRIHTAFVQSIRGVETWRSEGGAAVELTAGYDNAWSKGDGVFILSNKPGFDPAAVFQDQDWRPLRRSGN